MADLKTIYIVAGGTGGHVFPAKRVAQKYLNNCLLYTSDAADE